MSIVCWCALGKGVKQGEVLSHSLKNIYIDISIYKTFIKYLK